MQRLARAILVVVGLFVALVATTLWARSRSAPVEPAGASTSTADLTIKEADIEEEKGGVRWRLTAEQALIFEEEGRTTLRKLSVDVHERNRSWTITGDEGDLFKKTKQVEVRGNVVVTSSDGVRFETSVVRWDGEERRLWTDQPLRLARDGSTIEGSSMEVRLAEETTTIAGPVRATFAQRRGR
jgi:LPS export ABC transporter protein LptC